ncbi:UNVERIFIED_CONTAM: hypothetical protein NCL1_56236 [Trichonephila clavipes]
MAHHGADRGGPAAVAWSGQRPAENQRRALCPGYCAVFRQPVSAGAQRPGQAGHDYPAGRRDLAGGLVLSGAGYLAYALSVASGRQRALS